MSAIRSSANRSQTRKKRTAPYARGLFGTFARFFGFGDDDQTEDSSESSGGVGNGVATNLSMNGHAQKPTYSLGNRSPLKPSQAGNGLTSALPESPTSVPNSEQVANFFSQRMGTNISANEVETMVSNLQTAQEPEGFRFTFTTPGRESSPSFHSPQVISRFSPTSTPSRKKLTKNPNGVYRWEGAGSAKQTRQRNRFGSPAFAASPSRLDRSNTNGPSGPAEAPSSDNKRRRVGEEPSSNAHPSGSGSAPNGSVPFPVTSPATPRSNGIQRQTSPLPSSRLRTPAKPTAPVNPSPLRQAWSDRSSSSSREGDRTSPSLPSKASKTASFVADLIKETAPPNKPDLSNPYQSASPLAKVGPPRRSKRPRATGRPVAPTKEQKEEEEKQKAEERKKKEEEEKMKAMSAQAIIEATVPKGSKRSRPPAHLENKTAGESSRSSPPRIEAAPAPAQLEYVVEEANDDDEEQKRSSKRSKPMMTGRGLPSSLGKVPAPDVTVEELQDVEVQSVDKGQEKDQPVEQTKSGASRNAQFGGFKPTTIPREPSKLRFSIQPESVSSSASSTPAPTPSLPELATANASPPPIQSMSNGFSFSFASPTPPAVVTPAATPKPTGETKPTAIPESSKAPQQGPDAVRENVRVLDVKSLPTFVIAATTTSTLPSSADHVKARDSVRALPTNTLPKYNFNPTNVASGSSSVSASTSTSSSTPTASAPVKGFDFAAAGMKAPNTAKDTWKCGVCMVDNPLSTNKCVACEDPRPCAANSSTSSSSSSSSLFGFAPRSSAPSPASATSENAPKPALQVFNWSAAGMKAPTTDPNTWKCSVCDVTNPKSSAKCPACEEPAPVGVGAASAPTSAGAGVKPSIFGGSGSSTSGGFKPTGFASGFTPSGFKPSSSGSTPSSFTPSTSGFKPTTSGGFTPSGVTPNPSGAKPTGFTPSFGSFGTSSASTTLNPSASSRSALPVVTPSSALLAPAVTGFNFAAAGMEPPTAESGTWMCSLCGLKNSDGADKCQTCDQPK